MYKGKWGACGARAELLPATELKPDGPSTLPSALSSGEWVLAGQSWIL